MNSSHLSVRESISFARQRNKNNYIICENITIEKYLALRDSISSIPGRVRFIFSNCHLSTEGIENLGRLFCQKNEIDALIFTNVVIANYSALCEAFENAISLSVLSFDNANIDETKADEICNSIRKMIHLSAFGLSNDRCNASFFDGICKALISHEELESFSWTDSVLGDSSAFLAMFRSCPQLSTVDLSGCSLDDIWRGELSALLDSSWKLSYLTISDRSESLMDKAKRNAERAEAAKAAPGFRLLRLCRPEGLGE